MALKKDLSDYSKDELRNENAESVDKIASELAGSGLYKMGSLFTKSEVAFQMSIGKAQIEQNWILIRQNEEIIRLLDKIDEKLQG